MVNDKENLKKRLIYRSQYRGTKEMDKLIGSFVQINIDRFDVKELKELEKFLNFEDEIIFNFYQFNIIKNNIDKNEVSKLFKDFKI